MNAAEDLPPVIGLMLGSEDDVRDFQALTDAAFPLFRIPSLEFMQFIDTAPPKLLDVNDGVPGKSWDWLDDPPKTDEIRATLKEGK